MLIFALFITSCCGKTEKWENLQLRSYREDTEREILTGILSDFWERTLAKEKNICYTELTKGAFQFTIMRCMMIFSVDQSYLTEAFCRIVSVPSPVGYSRELNPVLIAVGIVMSVVFVLLQIVITQAHREQKRVESEISAA